MPLIGISGKAGAGKDLVGVIIQYLVHTTGIINMEYWEEFKNKSTFNQIMFSQYVIKKFADKLKTIVCLLIGCTREQLEDREFKEKELGEEWWYWSNTALNICPKEYGTFPNKMYRTKEEADKARNLYTLDRHNLSHIVKPTPRILLQQIGTDLFRNQLHSNTWVNASFANYLNNAWIFTDVRFPNEADSIKDRGGITIRINRPCSVCGGVGYHKLDCRLSEHESETALDNYEFDYVIKNDGTIEELIKQVKEILIKEEIL